MRKQHLAAVIVSTITLLFGSTTVQAQSFDYSLKKDFFSAERNEFVGQRFSFRQDYSLPTETLSLGIMGVDRKALLEKKFGGNLGHQIAMEPDEIVNFFFGGDRREIYQLLTFVIVPYFSFEYRNFGKFQALYFNDGHEIKRLYLYKIVF